MKAILRLLVGLCIGRKRSASSYQQSALSYQLGLQLSAISSRLSEISRHIRVIEKLTPNKELSAIGDQPSDSSRWLPAISKLIPRKELSAIGSQPSNSSRSSPIKFGLIPKTQYLIPFLFLVFVSCGAVLAQEPVVHSAPAAQAEITPLNIGDKIPDELWDMYFPVVSANSDEVQYLSLGDFKDKLIILDFWATWCAPCISSLHKLDTLQEQFKDDLMVIPTSYEPESKVLPFLTDRKLDLPSLIDETELRKYFRYRSIPHQVWIKRGEVIAVTIPEAANTSNLQKVIAGETLKLIERPSDILFNSQLPLFYQANGGDGSSMIYQSVLSYRIPEDIGGVNYTGRNNILFYNGTVADLYNEAFRKEIGSNSMKNRMIWETSDAVRKDCTAEDRDFVGDYVLDSLTYAWADSNIFCYNLVTPIKLSRDDSRLIMQQELNRVFGALKKIQGNIELRSIQCAVIKKSKDKSISCSNKPKQLITNETDLTLINQPIEVLIGYLKAGFRNDILPIYDATDYNGNIDIKLTFPLNNIPKLKKELSKAGLDLEIRPEKIDMLVMKGVGYDL